MLGLRRGEYWGLVAAFAVVAAIRAVPELLAGPYPLGFDTVTWYAPFVVAVRTQGGDVALRALWEEQTAPLLYLLLLPLGLFVPASPWMTIKVLGPVLHGLFAAALYAFGRRVLGWSPRLALAGAVLAALLFATLRLSWDLYRNLLGYTFFVLALIGAEGNPPRRGLFVAASVGVALAHELTAALLLLVLVPLILARRSKRDAWRPTQLGVVLGLLAALAYYTHWLWPVVRSASVFVGPVPTVTVPTNYLEPRPFYGYDSVLTLAAEVGFLLALVIAPLVPALRVARARSLALLAWTAVLGVLVLSPFFSPTGAAPAWERWGILLGVPLALWAMDGLVRLPRKKAVAVVLVVGVMTAAYAVLPPDLALPVFVTPLTTRHMPSSMEQSTIPLSDVPDVLVLAARFREREKDNDTRLFVHLIFSGWVRTAEPEGPYVVYLAWADVRSDATNPSGWVLWWLPGEGWYPTEAPGDAFVPELTSGRLALYRYGG
jgi:hypothetical protein